MQPDAPQIDAETIAPSRSGIHQLFENRSRTEPNGIAVEENGTPTSYARLNAHANQLARSLVGQGLLPGELVGVLLPRSRQFLVAILAVLKAGGVYVPLNPEYPSTHLQKLSRDARLRAIIADRSSPVNWTEKIPVWPCEDPGIDAHDPADLASRISAEGAAYVVFTSGSTGQSKGVVVPHRALTNHAQAIARIYELGSTDRVLQFASLSFDVAAEEIFPTWLAGGTVVLRNEAMLASFVHFDRFIAEQRLTVLNLPASFWKGWVEHLAQSKAKVPSTVRLVVAGNEVVWAATYQVWRTVAGPHIRWLNAYGPTEATITATLYEPPAAGVPAGLSSIPIGRPLPHVEVRILDEQGRDVAAGMAGEIHLGGVGLATGYLHQPQLTAERFITDTHGQRLYRSGDVGRFLADGNIEFIGRSDEQVKVRGFRIEPGEIEAALALHPEVRESVVLASRHREGETQLVAVVVPVAAEPVVELWPCPGDYQLFDETMYFAMTHDQRRNERYGAAFVKHVRGQVALDIGTGRDVLLARMMIAAGARKVYALEVQPDAYQQALATVARLGWSDRIIVLPGDSMTVTLPELVDVCASELIGTIGNSEGAVTILNDARRFLKPGGIMIPTRCATRIAAVTLPETLRAAPTFAEMPRHYAEQIFHQAGRRFDLRLAVKNFPPTLLLSDDALFEDLDFAQAGSAEFQRPIKLTIQRGGLLDGFLLWLNLFPAEGELIDTLNEPYSWLPVFFPAFDPPLTVSAGDTIMATGFGRLGSDQRRPDYGIEGNVTRAGKADVKFHFEAPLFTTQLGGNDFYRRLLDESESSREIHRPASSSPTSAARSGQEGLSSRSVRDYLRGLLPDYMVPSRVVLLERLPRLTNEKIDRQSVLAAIERRSESAGEIQPARTPLEEVLRQLWQEALGREEIGTQDDFFVLGGHSLHATQVMARVNDLLGLDLPVTTLFECPTVTELALKVETLKSQPLAAMTRFDSGTADSCPLSFAQTRLWFLEQLVPGQSSYNMAEAIWIDGELDLPSLERGLNEILRRHEILRTTYGDVNGMPHQQVRPPVPLSLTLTDLRHLSVVDRRDRARDAFTTVARRPFDLTRDQMLRAALWQIDEREYLLGLTLHHIAADGWSVGILLDELTSLVFNKSPALAVAPPGTGTEHGSPPFHASARLPMQYRDYALWQRDYLQGTILRRQLQYWRRQLGALPPPLALPFDRPGEVTSANRGGVVRAELSAALVARLQELSQRERATLFMTLLAVFQALLHRVTGQTDIALGSPIAGRAQLATQEVMGFFVNTLVLRTDLSGNPTFRELLARSRETALGAYAHQDIPFEKLVEELQPPRERSPFFHVMFALQNAPLPRVKSSGVSVRVEEVFLGASLFDLVLNINVDGPVLQAELIYDTALFDPRTVASLWRAYENLLAAVAEDATRLLSDLPLPKDIASMTDPRAHEAQIEEHLRREPAVADCVVRVRVDLRKQPLAIAYIVGRARLDRAHLGRMLASQWPHHSCVCTFVVALPRTSSGEIDEEALRALPVLDEEVRRQCEEQLRAWPGVQEVTVRIEECLEGRGAWNLSKLLPPFGPLPPVPKANLPSSESRPSILDGGVLLPPSDAPQVLNDCLARAAEGVGTIGFVDETGLVEFSYAQWREQAARLLNRLRKTGLAAGDKIVFQLEKPADFLTAFWACLLGGLVPVPLQVPPLYEIDNLPTKRLVGILATLDGAIVLTTPQRQADLSRLNNELTGRWRIVALAELETGSGATEFQAASPDDLALLMPTSGSTGEPKLVTLSHRQLISRAVGSIELNGFSAAEVSFNWMPLDHVAGLIYFHLRDVYLGCRQVHAAPTYILSDPLRWLMWLDKLRATVTFAPNFAFALVNERAAELGRHDLSALRYVLNGAEAIVPRTARKFMELLQPMGLSAAAMRPAWGMAETASGVVYSDRFRLDSTSDSDTSVAVGRPIPGITLRVVDDVGSVVPEGIAGHLQIRGATVTTGYFQRPDLNEAAFSEGWFKTGDLGFIRDGSLTVTGREKEVIVVHGINYAALEVESIVDRIEGVEPSGTSACAVRPAAAETDELAIFFVPRQAGESAAATLVTEIRRRVAREAGLGPAYVVPLQRDEIPRTSLGKIQRNILRQRFEAGLYQGRTHPVEGETPSGPELPDWFALRRWKPRALRPKNAAPSGPTLLFSGRSEWEHDCAKQFGPQTIVVERGASFARLDTLRFQIDPAAPDDYGRLLEVLDGEEIFPEQAVHLWSTDLSPEGLERPTPRGHEEIDEIRALLQGWSRWARERSLRLLVCARASQDVDAEPIDVSRAALAGFLKVVAQEMPSIGCTHLDLRSGADLFPAQLAEEAAQAGDESEVAWRAGVRLVPLLERLDFTVTPISAPLPRGGLYLLSGGGGGIGLALARRLLNEQDARLLLVGRRPLTELSHADGTASPPDASHDELRQWLHSDRVRYCAVDVADAAVLRREVAAAELHWGLALSGVFHLAALAPRCAITRETSESVAAVLHPKIQGALALGQLLIDRPGAIFIAFSSVNSIFGGRELAAYAAANRGLEAVVHQLRRQGCPRAYCYRWAQWDGIGLSRHSPDHAGAVGAGFEPMTADQGWQSLLVCLRYGIRDACIGLDRTNPFLRRFFEHRDVALEYLQATVTPRAEERGTVTPPRGLEVRDRCGHSVACRLETVTEWVGAGDGAVKAGNAAPAHKAVRPPRTEVERLMLPLWRQLLRRPELQIDDNFFELGGHSLLATQLVSRLRESLRRDVPLQLLFQFPTIAQLAEHLPAPVPARPSGGEIPLQPIARQGRFPVSFAQERLWFFDRLIPGSSFYNIPLAVRWSGPLDVSILERSFDEMVRRHESLRTTIAIYEAVPMQLIAAAGSSALERIDLSAVPMAERDEELNRLLLEKGQRGFDLGAGPLLRVCLIRLEELEHVLFVTLHHIISDGWSQSVFWGEISKLYAAFGAGQPSPLPELTVQYADFAQWQRRWMQGTVLAEQLTYWRKQLAGAPLLLDLPTDHPRSAWPKFRGRTETFAVSPALLEGMQRLCQQSGATLFMTLLAAFKILLSRYARMDDIVVGTPIANRNRLETEGLIGFLANTLVLRTDLSGDPSFRGLLRRVQATALGAYEHQDLPFEKLVEALNPERDLSRQPLFQVMFVLQNAPKSALDLAGVTSRFVSVDLGMALFDLTLYVEESEAGLNCACEYNSDLFEPQTIQRLVANFLTLLEGITANPEAPLSRLPLLSPAEAQLVTVEWNRTATDYARERCIHELFEEQVACRPQAVALVAEGREFTYAELNERANRLAHHLRGFGIGPNKLVAILMERSVEVVVALLGVLKAGGAYVPLATEYPAERLSWMLHDAQPALVLADAKLVPQVLGLSQKALAFEEASWAGAAATNPLLQNRSSEDLAYLIYTSGSTGTPKGVAVVHRGVVRLVTATNYVRLNEEETLLHMAPISFDASTFEIWGALLNGARLVLMPPGPPALEALGALLRRQHVTTLWLTADLFHLMVDERLDALKGLRQLLAGGDVLSVAHVNKLLEAAPHLTLINGYGPTETTTFALCLTTQHPARFDRQVPIGRPISNSTVFILDPLGNPVPIGVAGELYLGGDGLARGYYRRPDLTAEKFVPNPFSTDPAARFYRTGDFGRFRSDGTVEFLGRQDLQVKVRGFRIELHEIEAVLEKHPAVARAVVMARAQPAGGKVLVGYYSLHSDSSAVPQALRDYLKERLPEYMVPSVFVLRTEWPLTPNGKVDRAALPWADERAGLPEPAVAPRDLLEVQLKQIWESVLGLRAVGIQDNFFSLGGHSLLAVRLFIEIEKRMGKRLPLATLFQAPTVEQLASFLRREGWTPPWSSLVAIKPGGFKPPFFIIHGVGGNVLNFHGLARHLGEDQPVYGLQSQGLDGRKAPPTRIEDMAAHYIQEIRTVQPHGPFFLGGMSFGGVVAFEMAQQLHAQNLKVGLLALLDSYPLGYSELTPITQVARTEIGLWRQRARGHFKAFAAVPLGQKLPYLGRKVRTIRRRLKSGLWRLLYKVYARSGRSLPDGLQNVKEANFLAAREYVTKVYPGKVDLFIASEQSIGLNFDPTSMWNGLAAGGVEVHQIPGNHVTLIEEPHVQVLAARLRDALDRTL